MKSAWVDQDAAALVDHYGQQGVSADLALRVYTTRLLGRDPKLVLHGGGNTSVKTHLRDLLGDEVAVLCVKGSGWDMARIEPEGLPALRLDPLRRVRSRDALSDEEMVRIQRSLLIDPMAPNPSVETLLHAFLPRKFVDHTHSSAVLSLTDQPDGAAVCGEVYDGRVGIVPYLMPGFALAKAASGIYEADPNVDALILLKHGIFTFADTAREAYERMIEMVSLAEARLRRGRKAVFATAQLPQHVAPVVEIAPIIRGACSRKHEKIAGAYRRAVLEFRTSPAILNYVNGAELDRYARAGVVTPDHSIRTKNLPLIVPAPGEGKLAGFKQAVEVAVRTFIEEYEAYFSRNNAGHQFSKRMLDPVPRVVLVPAIGLFALGGSKKEGCIIADLAESAIETITDAEAIGRFQSISESEMFAMEYWSLEQAKLGQKPDQPLAGQIVVITGGAGAIGQATARAFGGAGAQVALLDVDEVKLRAAANAISGAVAIKCDVTDTRSIRAAFDAAVEAFGGIDMVVSNAGAAFQGRIGEVEESVLRRSFELNFFAHQLVAQHAVRIMMAQGTGGALLFNLSKQAVNPGPDFGPYGLPKAATLALVRQYALEYGKYGIRANAVNADRVRSGLLTPELIATRAAARGVSEDEYMAGNLLGREVTAEDVAHAFLYHATALKTTADITTVDGGNIAAALR